MPNLHLTFDRLGDAVDNAHLEKALEAVSSVEQVELDTSANRARIVHQTADPAELIAAARQLGYNARVAE